MHLQRWMKYTCGWHYEKKTLTMWMPSALLNKFGQGDAVLRNIGGEVSVLQEGGSKLIKTNGQSGNTS